MKEKLKGSSLRYGHLGFYDMELEASESLKPMTCAKSDGATD